MVDRQDCSGSTRFILLIFVSISLQLSEDSLRACLEKWLIKPFLNTEDLIIFLMITRILSSPLSTKDLSLTCLPALTSRLIIEQCFFVQEKREDIAFGEISREAFYFSLSSLHFSTDFLDSNLSGVEIFTFKVSLNR